MFAIFTFLSLILLFAASLFSFACGIYYLAELTEEFPTLTAKILRVTIWVFLLLHVSMLLFDDFPVLCVGVGFIAHVIHYQLLRNFPDAAIFSPQCIGSLVVFLLNHVLWFRYFLENPGHKTVEEIIAFFFIAVWAIPIVFFLSLSFGEDVLPVDGYSYKGKQQKQFFIKRIAAYFGFKKENNQNTYNYNNISNNRVDNNHNYHSDSEYYRGNQVRMSSVEESKGEPPNSNNYMRPRVAHQSTFSELGNRYNR